MPADDEMFRVPRWRINRDLPSIQIYRLPIERLTKVHYNHRWHKQIIIESVVFSAVADLLDTNPWQLAPDRFNPH